MQTPQTSSALRSWFFGIGIFLIGMAAGALGSLALNLAGLRSQAAMPIARTLDTDFLYLKSGQMVTGKILSRNDREIVVEIEQGTLKLRPDEIERIEEDYYTRYFKKVA